ncbi:YhbY family RNA-binding protein [Niveibacterium umoris]|uniref:Putative YhbY family RNA-binding protein n=1 Tax=Niveibacterium umoris TaxID=1193620 RepID=A0A840BNM7_9RHOO|nr:YhbY family RNA-binding protein [Niveibacterium umoris]MBB4012067.1 putative YhbY family RNA-binding protein [Niveibacterium umoris]
MKTLTSTERRELRARAHALDPVVSIAEKGLAPSVLKEIDRSLTAHELIKIRVFGDDREARHAYMTTICDELGCAPVQIIGKLLVVFRPAPEADAKPEPKLPARPRTASPRSSAKSAGSRAGSAPRPATKLRGSALTGGTARPRTTAVRSGTPRKPKSR